MEHKLYVHIVKMKENEFGLAGLSEDKVLWYALQLDYLDLNIHQVLISKLSIKGVLTAIKLINGYRKCGIKLDYDLKKRIF